MADQRGSLRGFKNTPTQSQAGLPRSAARLMRFLWNALEMVALAPHGASECHDIYNCKANSLT